MSSIFRKDIKLAESSLRTIGIDEDHSGAGLKYRETRIKIPTGINCMLNWYDMEEKILSVQINNISRYGCRVMMSKDLLENRLFVKIKRAQIEIDSVVAYKGAIMFVSERQERDGSITLGVALEQGECDLDVLTATAELRNIPIDSQLQSLLSSSITVSRDFKVLVADLNSVLQVVKQKLEVEELRLSEISQSHNHRMRLEERMINVAMGLYRPIIQNLLLEFQKLVSGMSVDEEIAHKQYFRTNFQSLVKGTPFIERGIGKPLGYSGDYGMMVMLYEYSDMGSSLFNRFFHRFVCSEPAALANRNRIGFLSDVLAKGYAKAVNAGAKSFRVTSLACGPAREIVEFLTYVTVNPDVPIELTLIDMEAHALDYAQKCLRDLSLPHGSVTITFLKEDVVAGVLKTKEFLGHLKDSDFIISAGLFDYLADRVSRRMISHLYQYLKSDGEILIGNISKKSPDVFAMDYFMDWRLILRNEGDLANLVTPELLANGGLVQVTSESLGLNLFLIVKRGNG